MNKPYQEIKNNPNDEIVLLLDKSTGRYWSTEMIDEHIQEFDDEIKKLGGNVESVTVQKIMEELGLKFEVEKTPWAKGRVKRV